MQHHSVVRRHLSYFSCFPFVFLALLLVQQPNLTIWLSSDLSSSDWSICRLPLSPSLSLSHTHTHTHTHTHIHTHTLSLSLWLSLNNSLTHSLTLNHSLSLSLCLTLSLSLYINLGPWSRFSNRWYKSSSKVLLESFWSKTTGRCDILYWNRSTWKWATEYWRSPAYRGQKSSQIR